MGTRRSLVRGLLATILGLAFIGAAMGQTTILEDFEVYDVGQNDPLLRHPKFSGSSDPNVSTNIPPDPPYATIVDDTFANDRMDPSVALPGLKSEHTYWTFTPEAYAGRPWVRLTTFNANGTPNPVIDITKGIGFFILTTNDEFYVHIGIREVTTEEPIGGNGGFSGSIEYVGATNDNGLVRGTRLIEPSDQWQYVHFDLPNEPVLGFTGDGVLFTDNGKAVIEHIGVTYSDTSTGGDAIDLWIDDVHLGDPITPLTEPLRLKITNIEALAGDELLVSFVSPLPGRDHFLQEPVGDLLIPTDWTDVADVTLTGPTDNIYFTAQFADPGTPRARYRVASVTAPPLFEDDMESGDAKWTTGGANNNWALGIPTNGPGAAYSPDNCWATGLGTDYPTDSTGYIRTTAFDLTGVLKATLKFAEFRDVEDGWDFVLIEVKDAADPEGTPLATLLNDTGTVDPWTEQSIALPPGALGQEVMIEFRIESDDAYVQQGWYIDDVSVIAE